MKNSRRSRRDFLAASVAGAAASLHGGLQVAAAEKSETVPIEIDCDFPGGNIVLERIEGDDVYLHQDPRDTPGFWFYWYFRVRGATGRRLRFHFTRGNVLGTRGPAVSIDRGRTWNWLGIESVQGASFSYSIPPETDEVRFCLAFPYLENNLREFLGRHAGHPHLRVESHATTRGKRDVSRLRLGRLDGEPAHRVLLTCRHHCCEMMASWALEGILESVLADTPLGRWFQEHVELAVIPFMDTDGVEQGDQGKNRSPHDHNRDYLAPSIYPATAALREFVPKWSRNKLRIALDMHCPYIRGRGGSSGGNERLYFVGGPSPEIWTELERFSTTLEQVRQGPLVYRAEGNLPFGQQWNTLAEPRNFAGWAAQQPGVLVAATLEIPYATVDKATVTENSARKLGLDLVMAMRRYLAEK